MYLCVYIYNTYTVRTKWNLTHRLYIYICCLTMPAGLRVKGIVMLQASGYMILRRSSNAMYKFIKCQSSPFCVSGSRTLTLPKHIIDYSITFLRDLVSGCLIVTILTEIYEPNDVSTPCLLVWFPIDLSNFHSESCWSVPVLTIFLWADELCLISISSSWSTHPTIPGC